MQITEEIFQVGGTGITATEDAAVYLIRFGGDAALVDAGCGGSVPGILKNIKATGTPHKAIAYLLVTHCHYDHTGGTRALREKLACRVVAHELDAPYLEAGDDIVSAAKWYGQSLSPCPVDIKLAGERSTLSLGGRDIHALHIPGHSPGSLAYYVESGGKRVLFAQDVHGPLAPTLLSDSAAYRHSLEKLLGLDADILCEGHYGVYRGKEEIRRFIQSFISRS